MLALATPWLRPFGALGAGRPGPNSRLGVAVIGLGDRGSNHVSGFADLPGCQVVAVCDAQRRKAEAFKDIVDRHYAQERASGSYRGCSALTDFREVLARPDVDVVVITAPENWHGIMASWAAKAGKDVYCEKALTLTVEEGRRLVEIVRSHGRILQVGTQQRSDRNFRFACELARNGYLGKVHTVRVSVPGGRKLPSAEPKPPPADVDYDLWLGPAPWTPYNDLKCTYNWYFMADYCAGWIQSWGVHHLDIALWGMPALAASTLEIGGRAVFPDTGLADTSINWEVEAAAPDGLKLVFTDDATGRHGCRFEGDRGWVHVVRGGLTAGPTSLLQTRLQPGDTRLPVSSHHLLNFAEAVKTRRDPIAPVEAGHAATTLSLISDIATRVGGRLQWDWRPERFLNHAAANRLLRRSMRSPWTL